MMELQAVFVRGGDGKPVALFSDADQAQRWRREHHGDNAIVVPVEASVSDSALKDAAEVAASAFPTAAASVPGTTADPDAVLRGQVRARLEQEEREKRIEAEVRAEMGRAKPPEPASNTPQRPEVPQARRA